MEFPERIKRFLGLGEPEYPVIKRSEIPPQPGVEGVQVHPGEHLEAQEVRDGGEVIAEPAGAENLPVEVPPLSREQLQQLKKLDAGLAARWRGSAIERLQLQQAARKSENPA